MPEAIPALSVYQRKSQANNVITGLWPIVKYWKTPEFVSSGIGLILFLKMSGVSLFSKEVSLFHADQQGIQLLLLRHRQ